MARSSGRRLEKSRRLGRIAWASATLKIEHREGKQCVPVTFIGGEFVPLHAFASSSADAEPPCVKLAEQRHLRLHRSC